MKAIGMKTGHVAMLKKALRAPPAPPAPPAPSAPSAPPVPPAPPGGEDAGGAGAGGAVASPHALALSASATPAATGELHLVSSLDPDQKTSVPYAEMGNAGPYQLVGHLMAYALTGTVEGIEQAQNYHILIDSGRAGGCDRCLGWNQQITEELLRDFVKSNHSAAIVCCKRADEMLPAIRLHTGAGFGIIDPKTNEYEKLTDVIVNVGATAELLVNVDTRHKRFEVKHAQIPDVEGVAVEWCDVANKDLTISSSSSLVRITVSGLAPASKYKFKVRATSGNQKSSWATCTNGAMTCPSPKEEGKQPVKRQRPLCFTTMASAV